MSTAPDLEPSLNDALAAMDRLNEPFNSHRVADLNTVSSFLSALYNLAPQEDTPMGVPQAEALEDAYQSGFRVLDKRCELLVVSVADFYGFRARRQS